MQGTFDAIVLGLGAMGSATLFQLARRGVRALGIDQFSPPHDRGSSHGDTRITRLAIGEGEQYTPLAMRSHEIWREIERETGESLLVTTGGLVISGAGPRGACHGSGFFENTLAAARRFGIRHEVLDAAEIRRRFPPFAAGEGDIGYYEHEAGYLRPEACIAAQLRLAERLGARVHRGERVLGFAERGGIVRVTTAAGAYEAPRLVVTAGPWLPELLGEVWAGRFTVRRQVLFWFPIDGPVGPYLPGRFPVFIWELAGHDQPIYGFPAIDGPGGGLKVASEQHAIATTPSSMRRDVDPAEAVALFDAQVSPYIRGLRGDFVKATACLYTMTGDFQFVIEPHPEMPAVTIASPCSGHGFKHSAAIGESLALAVAAGAG